MSFRQEDTSEVKPGAPVLEKEAIFIPEPPPRSIPTAEKLLALIMASNDPQVARTRGLVGKPLLYGPSSDCLNKAD